MGLTASFFGLGATLSNFLGQLVVENFGHVTSLVGSLIISAIPLLLFAFMPETLGHRVHHHHHHETPATAGKIKAGHKEAVDTATPYQSLV